MSRLAKALGTSPLYIGLVVLVLACAQVEPPPGGAEDKRGPCLIGSLPLNGAVSVPRSDRVTLYFSEPIKKPQQGKAVYVSPRLRREPELKWKNDRLVVIFPDSFDIGRTYLISAGAEIKDLRGNSVDSGLTIAFSTGASIDSGAVSGTVTDENGKPRSGLMVALYESGWDEGYDSLFASYVTQTSAEGRFFLSHLPEHEYRLICFQDSDNDERFATAGESYAVPDRPIDLATRAAIPDLRLTLVPQDTVTPQIVAAAYGPDQMIRVRLSRPVETAPLSQQPERFRVADTAAKVTTAQAMRGSDTALTTTLVFYCGLLAPGRYRAELLYDTAKTAAVFDSMVAAVGTDQTPPELVRFTPGPRDFLLAGRQPLTLSFSEPVETYRVTPAIFDLLNDKTQQKYASSLSWSDPLHLNLMTTDSLPPGSYHLQWAAFEMVDRAGNALGDSVTSRSFTVTGRDELGWISGEVIVTTPGREDSPVVLLLRQCERDRVMQVPLEGRQMNVELPAGKYLLEAFLDTDGDGRRFLGSVWPYRLAETIASYPDTVVVRARFETAGIQFTIN